MEDGRFPSISHQNPETQIPDSCHSRSWEGRDGDDGVSSDSMLCIPGSRLVPSGFKQMNCTGLFIVFCLFFVYVKWEMGFSVLGLFSVVCSQILVGTMSNIMN